VSGVEVQAVGLLDVLLRSREKKGELDLRGRALHREPGRRYVAGNVTWSGDGQWA
jgi:hypothetical protein